ncbi:hypothetical protein F443_12946, partial [Phytophthora nicotianae P1569]
MAENPGQPVQPSAYRFRTPQHNSNLRAASSVSKSSLLRAAKDLVSYKLSNNTVDIMNTVFFAADLANIHKKARPCKTAYYGLSGQ